ncbi:Putative membrane protein ycf1 [Fusarium odoratissimum]|uniref:Putative membrane protein ycf1 n=1 Tax=Fusarium oxysporum f. sp. cubense (strain race 4) TaxID=2502994 RepID=N1RUH3_FUSC4|nr:Putative membrane protein ycf1 [Fusarium odoratissimum]
MMSNTVGRLALFATLPLLTLGFTVTQDNDGPGQTVAQAIFTGQGLSVVNWDLSAASGSYGSFADGPFGIGSGGILATGPMSGALPGGNRNVDNGHSNNGEHDSYCGPNSQNALVLYAGVFIDSGYNGVPDSIGLLAYTDNEHQLAVDGSGNRITVQSSLAKDPIAIRPPNSVTEYSRSTPPLIVPLPLPGGNTQLDIFLSICDINNAGHDSALLIKGTACTDCELTPNDDYAPARREQPTSTDATTTTYESTETTTTDSTTATATTTSGEIKSTSAEAAVTTKTTAKEPTTTAESTSTEEPTTASQSTDTNTSTELGTTVEDTTTSDYSSTTTVDELTTSSTNVSIVSTVTTTDATAVVTTDTASTVATDSASQPTTATLRESTTVALTSSTVVTTSEESVLQSDTTTTMSSDSNTASWSSSETSSTSSGYSNQATTSRASSSSETSLPLSSTEISSTEISSTAAVSQETSQTLTTHSEPYTTSTSSLIFSTSASGSIDSSSISVSTPASTISTGSQGSSSAGSTELVFTKPSSSQTTVYSVPYNSGKPGQSLGDATTVTTITYTIVNPYKPSELTVTEYCSTLSYQPCTRCAHQPIPSVSMTTQVVPCNGCGKQGENEVTVTVPCAAAT